MGDPTEGWGTELLGSMEGMGDRAPRKGLEESCRIPGSPQGRSLPHLSWCRLGPGSSSIQRQQVHGMLDGAERNGLAGKWDHQAGLPSAPSPFPSHLTSSGPDLTLQQGMGKPGRGGHLGPRKGPSPDLCVVLVEQTKGVTQGPWNQGGESGPRVLSNGAWGESWRDSI